MPYLAGDGFTAADIMMLFALTTVAHFVPRQRPTTPHVDAYVARLTQRPAHIRAMQRMA